MAGVARTKVRRIFIMWLGEKTVGILPFQAVTHSADSCNKPVHDGVFRGSEHN